MIETGTQTAWIANTGKRPSGLKDNERVQIYWSDDSIGTHPVDCVFWGKNNETHCTHWRLAGNLTLDDALGEENTMYKMPFEITPTMQRVSYPETTYEPLPVPPSQNALAASIFNTLYPEPCALREVHVEALKAIVKLVEERGGE